MKNLVNVSSGCRKLDSLDMWFTQKKSPKNISEVRSFLGPVDYRRFVKKFSIIVSPMTKLLQKNVQFVWSDECQQSFDQLKRKLMEAPVLTQPESRKEFVVYSDASLSGLWCVLMQAGKIWCHYLYGEKCHYSPIIRWLELLKDYDLVIDYHPGKANVVTDALSLKSLFALRAMNTCDGSIIAELRARPLFLQQIRELEKDEPELLAKRDLI
ncbi:Integrase, catalytic core [Gossypium australe]|uniref:Integrase, catalytic core n=1 Tax=Gossypium australe TaxID=47621 RepID=A0A5B6VM91_9ROSI|nr:Integrase, catalytic core [Gossypium australe]